MSAAADRILRRATFFYRCRGVQLVGGTPHMVDSGPHGLHAAMSNFVAPAYGVVTLPSGRPAIQFNGTTQYATLPLRFYDHAPTDTMTFVWWCKYGNGLAVNEAVFNCRNFAVTGGFLVYRGAVDVLSFNAVDSGGVGQMSDAPPVGTINGRTNIDVCAVSWVDQRHAWRHNRITTLYTDGGTRAPITLDPTFAPTICRFHAAYMGTTLAALGLFPWEFTKAESDYMTDLLTAGAV